MCHLMTVLKELQEVLTWDYGSSRQQCHALYATHIVVYKQQALASITDKKRTSGMLFVGRA